MFKSGYVAVIGRPNAGKSTLLNRIVGEKISIVSNKAQTTRNNINFIYTDDTAQIIFLDTPGYQSPKNKLGKYMLNLTEDAIKDADIVLYIIDSCVDIGLGEEELLKFVISKNKKFLIAMNKIENSDKSFLNSIDNILNKYNVSATVIPISALNGENVDYLIDHIKSELKEGPMYYDPDYLTDKSVKFITSEIIREKCLYFLYDEIPHGINIMIDKFEEKDDIINIDTVIYCERESHKGMIIGKNGKLIKKISSEARKDLEHFLGIKVNLKTWIKVEKNWRNNDAKVKFFGYK